PPPHSFGFCASPSCALKPNQKPVRAKPRPIRPTKFLIGLKRSPSCGTAIHGNSAGLDPPSNQLGSLYPPTLSMSAFWWSPRLHPAPGGSTVWHRLKRLPVEETNCPSGDSCAQLFMSSPKTAPRPNPAPYSNSTFLWSFVDQSRSTDA